MRNAASLACLLALSPAGAVFAQGAADPASPAACAGIEADAERLACYDRAVGRVPADIEPPPLRGADGRIRIFEAQPDQPTGQRGLPERHRSLLDARWELSPAAKLGTFTLRAHQPVYALPLFYSDRVNRLPTSPNPANRAGAPLDIDPLEGKFQLSLKTKLVEGLFDDRADVWFGYTQSSRWQIFNDGDSRPFRETNYQPEAMLVFGTNYRVLGWDGRLAGASLVHHSNGRSLPLSRSWNRVRLDLALERGPWVLALRPWWRIGEDAADDDNPDIMDYLGHGEIQLVRQGSRYGTALTVRPGGRGRPSWQLDWTFPIRGDLRGYLQVFDGYGESLIDYNHRATYVGAGVSLIEWY